MAAGHGTVRARPVIEIGWVLGGWGAMRLAGGDAPGRWENDESERGANHSARLWV